jgi:hypothetical protein
MLTASLFRFAHQSFTMHQVLSRKSSFGLILIVLTGCASTSSTVPEAWKDVPHASRIGSLSYDAAGKLIPGAAPLARPTMGVAVHDLALERNGKTLTPRFVAIDSFDASEERKEVVFSARRRDNFDIGLVSVDGSAIHWIPEDPADETSVQWAPRGNKVSYFVHARGGDLVRTVHIPTSTQLTVAFPNASLHALAWDPAAERYAVAYDTPDASERVEVTKYSGEERRIVIPPAAKLDVEMEPIAGGIVLRPAALRYGERLPLVIWMSDRVYSWNDARAALIRGNRIACAVVTKEPDAAFWQAAKAIPWIDVSRAWIVGDARDPQPATTILPDPHSSPGHYAIRDNRVLVPPAIVESFAAGFIANQLKGTHSPNGRDR